MTTVYVTAHHKLDFVDSPTIFFSQPHGCVYGIVKDVDSDGDYLIQTPMNADNTWSEDDADWCEVDEMALLGEEEDIRLHVEQVWDILRRESDGIFADPMRMEDTPIAEAYGG